jgi:putative tricarboxylic transport membrane protein
MTSRLRFGTDAGFAIAMALIGLVAIVASWRTGLGSLTEPDAGLFPFFSGLAVFAGGTLVAIRAIRAPEGEPDTEEFPVGAQLAALLATMCAWIVVLPIVGFVLATFLVVLIFAKQLGLEGWIRPTVLAVCAALSVYILFQRMLFIDLPTGIVFG